MVLDKIWYAVFLRVPRAFAPLLGDVLALPLYARAMGEKPLNGRDIKGIPNGRCTRGFRGNDSERMGFVVEGGGNGAFLIVELTSSRGEIYHVEIFGESKGVREIVRYSAFLFH